jgi:hypothetical protein
LLTTVPNDLRSQAIRSYWGPVMRSRTLSEAPLWERIEIAMLSLLLDDYSLEPQAPLWLSEDDSLRFLRARTAIRLEKALGELAELLQLIKADEVDIIQVVKCRNDIMHHAVEDGRWRGARLGNGGEDLRDLRDVVSDCYIVVRFIECKYFSKSRERCFYRLMRGKKY